LLVDQLSYALLILLTNRQSLRRQRSPAPDACLARRAAACGMILIHLQVSGPIMSKIDFKTELKHLFAPSTKEFAMVDVPAMRYLMIDGSGNPNTSEPYKEAIEALYGVAYTLKFASKKELGRDYVVPPLEGLWWADDMSTFVSRNKDRWRWTMMIMVPEWIKPSLISRAIDTVRAKKTLAALPLLRHDILHEGQSVQIMYIGSYDDEGPVLSRLHRHYLPENNLTFNGKHHEIYLSDPRKTPAPKLKTILRQPVAALKASDGRQT
jgi:hypothetical protein